MKIRTITISGADDKNDPADLARISVRFPRVEWGILLSKTNAGRSRYPSKDWIDSLPALPLSGHLCGAWVRELTAYGENTFFQERSEWSVKFRRYQLNFFGTRPEPHDDFSEALKTLPEVIFQTVPGDDMYRRFGASPLFDASGGRGIAPKDWPEHPGVYCGYAGGLTPDNVADALDAIALKVGDRDIWIDVESGVRDNLDLNPDKVVRFLESVEKYEVD